MSSKDLKTKLLADNELEGGTPDNQLLDNLNKKIDSAADKKFKKGL